MRGLSDVTLRNWNGIEVGSLRATAELSACRPLGADSPSRSESP